MIAAYFTVAIKMSHYQSLLKKVLIMQEDGGVSAVNSMNSLKGRKYVVHFHVFITGEDFSNNSG